MSKKEFSDTNLTANLIHEIDAAERKLRMMKQYINPQTGTVRDTAVVAGLFNGADDCMKMINASLVKFL